MVSTTDSKFAVATKDTGTVSASKDDVVGVRNDTEEAAYEAEVEHLRHPRLSDFWSALLDTGLSLTRGNSESLTYNLNGKAARVTDRDKISVYTTVIYATSTIDGISAATANAIRGGVRGDLNISDKFFVFGFTDQEFDQFQDLDLRSVVGGGFGYHVLKTKNTTFDVFGGGTYDSDFFGAVTATATKPASPSVTRKIGEALAGETFNTKLNNRTTITQQFSFYPDLSDTGQYRLQWDSTGATKLKNWLSWQVTLSDRFLSNPLPGFKKNDLLLSTGLRFNFGKGVF